MEEQEYRIFDYWDFILPPIYLLVIFFLAEIVRARNIEKNPIYRFYTWGLFAKILGGITLALIYALHYKGGDTTGYFTDSVSMAELLKKDVKVFSLYYLIIWMLRIILFLIRTPGTQCISEIPNPFL